MCIGLSLNCNKTDQVAYVAVFLSKQSHSLIIVDVYSKYSSLSCV